GIGVRTKNRTPAKASEVHLLLLCDEGAQRLESIMAEARQPIHLLDVCNQKFSEFLFNAEHKCLMWLREIEEEAMKIFDRKRSVSVWRVFEKNKKQSNRESRKWRKKRDV
ncbi:hypothetical protein E2320_020801, partial [Naja naja]